MYVKAIITIAILLSAVTILPCISGKTF